MLNRTFADMDLVEVDSGVVPIDAGLRRWSWVVIVVAGCIVIGGLIWLARRNGASRDTDAPQTSWLPARDTPLSAIAALERLERAFGDEMPDDQRSKLRADIERLQARYFGRDTVSNGDTESLRPQVERWVSQLA
jgi:hypothetical protein